MRDPNDGGAFSKEEFLEYYGGLDEWEAAIPMASYTDYLEGFEEGLTGSPESPGKKKGKAKKAAGGKDAKGGGKDAKAKGGKSPPKAAKSPPKKGAKDAKKKHGDAAV